MLERDKLIEQNLITNKMSAIYDPAFKEHLTNMPLKEWWKKSPPFHCIEEYTETFYKWITASRLNRIKGLERFKKRHLIIGTTQSFDESYFRYRGKRLRMFKGEYAYHKRIIEDFKFIEDEPLREGDYAIISAPFCSTGDIHPHMNDVLDYCKDLSIPVILDCAYFGTCRDLELDASHPAIVSVNFSLTKGLGVGDLRSGIRFSDYEDSLPISQQNEYNHTVLFDAKVGIYMMNKFSADFIPEKYSVSQKEVCEELSVYPTKCMHIALGDGSWDRFIVSGGYFRLGIRELVKARQEKRI